MLVAFCAASMVHAFMYGPQAAFIAEQFPTQVRYAGASLAYTLGGIFAGGIAPLALTALYRAYGQHDRSRHYVAAALAVTGVVLFVEVSPFAGIEECPQKDAIGRPGEPVAPFSRSGVNTKVKR